jgi:hypothetical protein
MRWLGIEYKYGSIGVDHSIWIGYSRVHALVYNKPLRDRNPLFFQDILLLLYPYLNKKALWPKGKANIKASGLQLRLGISFAQGIIKSKVAVIATIA